MEECNAVSMRIGELPENVISSILMLLDFKSITRMKAVSKRWLEVLSGNQSFWKQRFEEDFWELEEEGVDYEQEYRTEFGWRIKDPSVLDFEAHQGAINDAKVKGSMLVTGSRDKATRVWNLDTMKCMHDFNVCKTVYSVAFNDDRVFAGLGSGEIYVWSLATGELCHMWQAHSDEVWPLGIANTHLLSGRLYGSLKIWDLTTYECLQTFEFGNPKYIHAGDRELVCGVHSEHQVHVFHQYDGFVYTLEPRCWLYSVGANSKYIFAGCSDNMGIQVWERETNARVTTLDACGHCDWVVGIRCESRSAISASAIGRIKIWDTNKLTCIRNIEKGSIGQLGCMHHHMGKVVLGASTGMVRVLNFGC